MRGAYRLAHWVGTGLLAWAVAPAAFGLSPVCRYDYGSPLLNAIADRRADEVAALLARGTDPNALAATPFGEMRPLRLAIQGQSTSCRDMAPDAALVRQLLAAGADPRLRWPARSGGRSEDALGAAATTGSVEIVRILLQAGARVNLRGPDGWTALHSAMDARREEMVVALLEAGADPNAVVLFDGEAAITPLHQAARWPGRDNRIARALVAHGARYLRTERIEPPLAQMGRFYSEPTGPIDELIRLLVRAGGRVDETGRQRQTALNLSVASSQVNRDVLEALLRAGASPNRGVLYELADRRDYGNVPLKRRHLLDLLVSHGARPDAAHPWIKVPLLQYARQANPAYAEELMQAFPGLR